MLVPFSFVLTLLLVLAQHEGAQSYPVVAQIDEDSERCFRFNIPGHDEAHIVVLTLPNDTEGGGGELETWFVEQAFKLTKLKTKGVGIGMKLPDEAPDEIAKKMSEFLQQNSGNMAALTVKMTDTPTADRPSYKFVRRTKYFIPTVVNNVQKTISRYNRDKRGGAMDENLEGFGICFQNAEQDREVHVVFDVVLASEEILGGEDINKGTDFNKEKHLTPLEISLDSSISAANSVLREMKYMEKREARMRQTAENINARVRWYSYLSVGVLLVVTYIQVSYLKRYFHKKKLM